MLRKAKEEKASTENDDDDKTVMLKMAVISTGIGMATATATQDMVDEKIPATRSADLAAPDPCLLTATMLNIFGLLLAGAQGRAVRFVHRRLEIPWASTTYFSFALHRAGTGRKGKNEGSIHETTSSSAFLFWSASQFSFLVSRASKF